MFFSLQTLLVLLAVSSTASFSVSSYRGAIPTSNRFDMALSMSEEDDKIASLRQAAAKAREEAERIRQELGEKSPSATTSTTVPKKTAEEVKAVVPTLLSETDLEKQAAGWKELKDSKSLASFGSANLRSFPVDLRMLEQRTGLTPEALGLDEGEVNLDDFKYATLWVFGGSSIAAILSLAVLPPNIGQTLCYLFALVPIAFLGIGSTAPAAIAGAIASVKGGGDQDDKTVSTQDRVCRHEAAHFCCGYWCGLPIREYSVQEGVARVEFAVANSKYSNTEIAALTVTALAGLVGEALQWKKVKSGSATADLLQLEMVFRQSADFLGAQQQQDLTRWGALTASLLLRQNEKTYEKVVEAFSRQAPLEECVALLEESA